MVPIDLHAIFAKFILRNFKNYLGCSQSMAVNFIGDVKNQKTINLSH